MFKLTFCLLDPLPTLGEQNMLTAERQTHKKKGPSVYCTPVYLVDCRASQTYV